MPKATKSNEKQDNRERKAHRERKSGSGHDAWVHQKQERNSARTQTFNVEANQWIHQSA